MAGKEGFWSVAYRSDDGGGFGLIALDSGGIVGADAAGGTWDGTYTFNQRTNLLELDLTVALPPNVVSAVTGMASPRGHVETYQIDLQNDLGREVPFSLDVQGRPMGVVFRKIRDFPQ